jgi:hypothetical protein
VAHKSKIGLDDKASAENGLIGQFEARLRSMQAKCISRTIANDRMRDGETDAILRSAGYRTFLHDPASKVSG